MRWGLEERITAPASRRAPCRQVYFPGLNTAFVSREYFFTIDSFVFLSFGVNMDKKKLVKKLQNAKTVMDLGSSVIQNYTYIYWNIVSTKTNFRD